jgi:hypothetical protein
MFGRIYSNIGNETIVGGSCLILRKSVYQRVF